MAIMAPLFVSIGVNLFSGRFGGSVLLFILFAEMLSYRVLTYVTGSLERLAAVMQKLTDGQFDVTIPATPQPAQTAGNRTVLLG